MGLYEHLKGCIDCPHCLKWNPYFNEDKLLNKFLEKCKKTCLNSSVKPQMEPQKYIDALKQLNKDHFFDDSRKLFPSSQITWKNEEEIKEPVDTRIYKCIKGYKGLCNHNICKYFGQRIDIESKTYLEMKKEISKPVKRGKNVVRKNIRNKPRKRIKNSQALKNITNLKNDVGINSHFSFVNGVKVYEIFGIKKTSNKQNKNEDPTKEKVDDRNVATTNDEDNKTSTPLINQKVYDIEDISADKFVHKIADNLILDTEIQSDCSQDENLVSSFIDESMLYNPPFKSKLSPIKGFSSIQELPDIEEPIILKVYEEKKKSNCKNKEMKMMFKNIEFEEIPLDTMLEKTCTKSKIKALSGTIGERFPFQCSDDCSISITSPCPSYKKIRGSRIAMDALNHGDIPGISFYFLSHFSHSNFSEIDKQWSKEIYCSAITANVVKLKYPQLSKYLVPLPMNKCVTISDFSVTLLPANYCPGSAIFCFKLANNEHVLHTGNFRIDSNLLDKIQELGCTFSTIYLDSTYLDPQYNFPTQDEVINFITCKVEDCLKREPKTLILYGAITIGKEDVFLDLAKKLNKKVYVYEEKLEVMKCFEDKEMEKYLTSDQNETNIHVVPVQHLGSNVFYHALQKYSKSYTKVLAVRPTEYEYLYGSYRSKSLEKDVVLMELPLYINCNFNELKTFIQTLKPNKVVPTVFESTCLSRKKMRSCLSDWMVDEDSI